MSAVYGFLTTTNATTNDLQGEWMDEIVIRQGKSANLGAPLQAICSKLETEQTDNTQFYWWERDPTRLNIYTNAGNLTSGSTALSFDDGASGDVNPYLVVGTTLINDRTLETVRVTADATTGGTVTVTRALGTTPAAAAILDNDLWTIVTKGVDEGADPGRALYEQPSSYYNYIQTFQETILVANAFKANVLRTDKQGIIDQDISNALERTVNRMELAYLIGQRASPSGTNGNVYLTGGLKWYIDVAAVADTNLAANVLEANGTAGVNLTDLLAWVQAFMVNGSDTKLMFCGPLAFAALSTFANQAAGGFRIMNDSGSVFGMNLTEIQTPFGRLSLAMHPLMKNSIANSDWGFVVDLQLIRNKVMTPLYFEENIQTPGQLSYKAQFVAMTGLKLLFPGAFGYVKNLRRINA